MKPLIDRLKEIETNGEKIMAGLLGTDDRPDDYEKGGWYDYNINKFGTKWDFGFDDVLQMDINDTEIVIDVDTAWSPPSPFVAELCILYGLNASVFYAEPGMDYAGKTLFNEEGVYDNDECTYLEGLYKHDDNFWNEVDFRAECAADNEETLEEFREEFTKYLNDDDMKMVDQKFAEAVQKLNEMN